MNENLTDMDIQQLEKLCKKNERLLLEYNRFTNEVGILTLDLKRVHKIKK